MHDHQGHGHSHEVMSKEETLAALEYMLKHNRHHTEELRELAHNLEHLELSAAAETLKLSAADYDVGNDKLEAAIKAAKGV